MPEYDQLSRLGAGAFGEVWLCEDRALGIKRAVKYVPPDRIKDPTNFYEEPRTLMKLRHENVVRVEDAGRTNTGRLYIAMEYLPNGSVEDVWKGAIVPSRTAIRYITDVCRGVEYAHEMGIIHRDIKPGNILVADDGRAKLSDFGLAARATVDGTASAYGYRAHLAPEVFTQNLTSRQSDIYALGVTLYRLLNGDALLPSYSSAPELEAQIIAGHFPNRYAYRPFVPRSLRTIVNRAMNIDPAKRQPTAMHLRHALEQVHLVCDWASQSTPSGRTWSTFIDTSNIEFEITITGGKAGYDLTLRRGRAGLVKRRVTADSLQRLTLDQMGKHVAWLLQRRDDGSLISLARP